jgi:hypothetical protein
MTVLYNEDPANPEVTITCKLSDVQHLGYMHRDLHMLKALEKDTFPIMWLADDKNKLICISGALCKQVFALIKEDRMQQIEKLPGSRPLDATA